MVSCQGSTKFSENSNKALKFYFINLAKSIKLSLARFEFLFLYIFQQYILKKLHNNMLLLFLKFAKVGATYKVYSVFTGLLISAFPEMHKYLPFRNTASRSIFLNIGNFSKTVRPFFQNDSTHNGDSKVLSGIRFLILSIKISSNWLWMSDIHLTWNILILSVKFSGLGFSSLTKDKLSVWKLN